MLIVEDEPLTAFDNESRLQSLGYTVVATRDNVEDALVDLKSNPVDLILTDIELAGKGSGLDLAREAKALGIPVLFATGNPPEDCTALAIGSLEKPYSDRDLKAAFEAVEDLLAGRSPKVPTVLRLYAAD